MTREEFMDIVYNELHSDGDNNRANRIIDAADEYEKAERESILDKLRAETLEYIDDLDIAMEICNIFDKYRTESEG